MNKLLFIRLYFPNGEFYDTHIWNNIDLNNCLKFN